MNPASRWWHEAVIYQIYPRSFMDSDGDGVGDLAGIGARLEHCRWLGVDAVWLSPIYRSPMADFGYDVSDHCDVDPRFGTLADFDALIARARELGLKVLLDFVPNHTSDRHPWFVRACESRASPWRDWYLWRDPGPDGGPPNNWISVFGGSAWSWHAPSGQYYLHSYLPQQPDLNWRNPQVRLAMYRVLRFWLRRGVDGFRVDAISRLLKDRLWRDEPVNPDYVPGQDPYRRLLHPYSRARPELPALIRRLRRACAGFGEPLLIGEAYLPLPQLLNYYRAGLGFPFNFELLRLRWSAPEIARAIERYERALDGQHWPNWVLGNHDNPRLASRVGEAQTRVAAMLLLTLRGTPTLYYGDEIGVTDVGIAPGQVRDPWEKNLPGRGLGRDPARTPMPWSGAPGAGFSRGLPWLPLGPDYRRRNVAAQRAEPDSLLRLYRRLLRLRRRRPALRAGRYRTVACTPQALLYERAAAGERLLVALNFSAEPARLELPTAAQTVLATTPGETAAGARHRGRLELGPGCGMILKVL